MKTKFFIAALSIVAGCFNAIDFPGEQAEFQIEPVNDIDAAGINEAIFDEFQVNALDLNADGNADIAVSALLLIGSDQAVDDLCDVASNADTFEEIETGFDTAKLAGALVVKVEDFAVVNGASGFDDGEVVVGDNVSTVVQSFFVVTSDAQFDVRANTAGQGRIEIEELKNALLSATFDDNLDLDFSVNQNGDAINSDFNAEFFNATKCDMSAVLESIINSFFP